MIRPPKRQSNLRYKNNQHSYNRAFALDVVGASGPNMTWQIPNDFFQLNKSAPPGFVYTCQPRGSGCGGGLAIIHREKWKVLPVSAPTFNSFESTVCQLSGPVPTIVATVYRPP